MSAVAPLSASDAVDLGEGKIWLLGGLAPVTEHFSWLPNDAVGWESLNCYLLLEDDAALLVDTGVALHSSRVTDQLTALIGRDRSLALYMTRIELDAVSGLGEICRDFNVTNLFASTGFNTNPLEFFDHLRDSDLRIERRQDREPITLAPGRDVEVIQPVLHLLPTSWLFDHATGTLFTSDSFGHLRLGPSESEPAADERVARQDDATNEDMTEHLFTKYEWLRRLQDPEYIATGVARVFETYDVKTIAPTHGRVIQGVDQVQKHKDWLISAILQCPTE